MKTSLAAAIPLLATLASAQSSCASPSGSIKPTIASGYSLQVVASGLAKPRGIAFDDQGHLLVVQQGDGIITSHTVNEQNGCVTLGDSMTVVDQGLALNHGIQVNGSTLYASNTNSAYSWAYNSTAQTVSNQEEWLTGMNNSDHATRTLLVSQFAPGMMVVSRGSGSNLDYAAASESDGPAQVRAFNVANRTGIYNWTDGLILGWGNRNEVGIGEHPETGGIYGVENSADQIMRDGVDVSTNNPGEELNFFGYLNGTPYDNQGGFFGYPWCLAVWNASELPNNSGFVVGDQFAFDASASLDNQNRTDSFCANETVDPRLTFQAHMAPLDIKFNNSGSEAWITFHGSWDRTDPVGYKLSVVQFQNGEPVDASTSTTAAVDILANQDLSACPDNCFRPVGLAFDNQGRVFMSSDASGEIYLITRTSEQNGTATSGLPTSSASGTSTANGSSSTAEGAASTFGPTSFWFGAVCTVLLLLLN